MKVVTFVPDAYLKEVSIMNLMSKIFCFLDFSQPCVLEVPLLAFVSSVCHIGGMCVLIQKYRYFRSRRVF